jgi:hypothetical protein
MESDRIYLRPEATNYSFPHRVRGGGGVVVVACSAPSPTIVVSLAHDRRVGVVTECVRYPVPWLHSIRHPPRARAIIPRHGLGNGGKPPRLRKRESATYLWCLDSHLLLLLLLSR